MKSLSVLSAARELTANKRARVLPRRRSLSFFCVNVRQTVSAFVCQSICPVATALGQVLGILHKTTVSYLYIRNHPAFYHALGDVEISGRVFIAYPKHSFGCFS